MQANSGDHDQTPLSAASDPGLHYLFMSHKDAMHIWVYITALNHESNLLLSFPMSPASKLLPVQ